MSVFGPMNHGLTVIAAVIGYVYPFMPSYIASFNLAPDDVARYAGLAVSWHSLRSLNGRTAFYQWSKVYVAFRQLGCATGSVAEES